MHPEVHLEQREVNGLRVVLNAWDPIGVYQPSAPGEPDSIDWPEDEYDCLRSPLVSRLESGASRLEIADFLRNELHDHFGVTAPITDDLLDGLFEWWKTEH